MRLLILPLFLMACEPYTTTGYPVGVKFTSEPLGLEGGAIAFEELGMGLYLPPGLADGVRFTGWIEPSPTDQLITSTNGKDYYLGRHMLRLRADGPVSHDESFWVAWNFDTGRENLSPQGHPQPSWSYDKSTWWDEGWFSGPSAGLPYRDDPHPYLESEESGPALWIQVYSDDAAYPSETDFWFGSMGLELSE